MKIEEQISDDIVVCIETDADFVSLMDLSVVEGEQSGCVFLDIAQAKKLAEVIDRVLGAEAKKGEWRHDDD